MEALILFHLLDGGLRSDYYKRKSPVFLIKCLPRP
jgi:hypothetical protein